MRSLWLPLLTAVLLIALGTALQGAFSQRWGEARSAKLEEYASRLAHVPNEIGDWQGEAAPIDAEQLAASHVAGHLSRVYRHRETGEEVQLFLVCGSARHIALHTPQWCYRAAGFEMLGEPELREIAANDLSPASFLAAVFAKETPTGNSKLEVCWTFGTESGWQGHRYPRTALAGQDAVYKLYLIRNLAGDDAKKSATSPCADFARELLPHLQHALLSVSNSDSMTAK